MLNVRNISIATALAVGMLPMGAAMAQPQVPQSIWIEAEWLGPLNGSNYSFYHEAQQTKGSWSISGPGVAAEWTQGGESGLFSIATRADEPAGVSSGRDVEIPVTAKYFLWVRYGDYRGKKEEFGVRVTQGGKKSERVFGTNPVIDDLDPLKLRWDWAFGWDSAVVDLQKGPARVELFTTGPTGARRQVDAICLTTDAKYRPTGRVKPNFAAWQTLRNLPPAAPSLAAVATGAGVLPIGQARPASLWNVRDQWLDQLGKPAEQRVEAPFSVDPSLLELFVKTYAGKTPPIYGNALNGPVVYIRDYPTAFKEGSTFLQWLDRNPDKQFAILLNYGEPTWPAGTTDADKQKAHAVLQRYSKRFMGYISGENIAYADVQTDRKAFEAKVRVAKSRADVLEAIREMHTDAIIKKFSDYQGKPISASEAWAPIVTCLSGGMEVHAHALASWGERRIGFENSGINSSLAQRMAFLRGAARQFGVGLVDYQSSNLGDSGTGFGRDNTYPASSRWILDNQYDAYAGAGLNWILKDFMLFHLAGVDAFYNEGGHDMFWKPGGGAAGDDFPMDISPRGKVAESMQRVTLAHPRGVQYTPVAFLLDRAHGWSPTDYNFSSFALDPQWNPKVLASGRHDASLNGWMDVAYYPLPEVNSEPSTGVRQTYVNGVFGDIFDALVTAPGKTQILASYPVIVAGGEINLTTEWGNALRQYVQNGGTLVASADQFSGPGAAVLGLQFGQEKEASSMTWKSSGQSLGSNVFRYKALDAGKDKVLAATPEGAALCTERAVGKGRIISIAVPLAIGLNERPTPLSGLVMRHVTQGLMPITVQGDVEWIVNRLDNGGWLVTILNNRGINKPQHGINPTDHTQAQTVTLRSAFPVKTSNEWMTETPQQWQNSTSQITVPAGAVRMVELRP